MASGGKKSAHQQRPVQKRKPPPMESENEEEDYVVQTPRKSSLKKSAGSKFIHSEASVGPSSRMQIAGGGKRRATRQDPEESEYEDEGDYIDDREEEGESEVENQSEGDEEAAANSGPSDSKKDKRGEAIKEAKATVSTNAKIDTIDFTIANLKYGNLYYTRTDKFKLQPHHDAPTSLFTFQLFGTYHFRHERESHLAVGLRMALPRGTIAHFTPNFPTATFYPNYLCEASERPVDFSFVPLIQISVVNDFYDFCTIIIIPIVSCIPVELKPSEFNKELQRRNLVNKTPSLSFYQDSIEVEKVNHKGKHKNRSLNYNPPAALDNYDSDNCDYSSSSSASP